MMIGCPLRRRQFQSQTVYFILFKLIILFLDNLPISVFYTGRFLISMSSIKYTIYLWTYSIDAKLSFALFEISKDVRLMV